MNGWKLIPLLLIVTLNNCFTTMYSKKFEPYDIYYIAKEFPQERKVVLGKIVSENGNQKIHAQFDSILLGEGRQLNIVFYPDSSKADVFDDYKSLEGEKKALIFFEPIGFSDIFKKEDRKINLRTMELRDEDTKENLHFFRIGSKIHYVELNRSKDDKSVFIKKKVPKEFTFDETKISYVERNRVVNAIKYGLFYCGYIVTIPLDAVTGIFQVIAYIAAGGGVK